MSAVLQPVAVFNTLSSQDARRVKQAFTKATRAVLGYDGQGKSWSRAIDALAGVEAERTRHFPAAQTHAEKMAAEAALSRQVRTGKPYSTDDLLDVMDRVAHRLFRQVAKRPEAEGIHTVRLNAPLVKPGPLPDGLNAGQGGPAYVPAAEDKRTERVLGLLYRNGIHMDELVRYVGPNTAGTLRRHPYTVIAVPSRDIEIAVCDEVGQTTLLARPALGPYAYQLLDKAQLKQEAGVHVVDHSSEERWQQEITAFVNGSPAGRKVSPKEYASKPARLSVAVLNELQRQQILQTGSILTRKSKNIAGEVDQGETPVALNKAIENRGRGLKDQIPDMVKTLVDFAHWQQNLGIYNGVLAQRGINSHQAGIKRDLTIDHLNELQRKQILTTGYILTGSSENIVSEMGAGETPASLDGAIRFGIRGLKGQLPDKVKSLVDFACWQYGLGAYKDVLTQKRISANQAGIKRDLTITIDHLNELQRQQILQTGHILTRSSEHIAGKVDEAETPEKIDSAIRHKIRGLKGQIPVDVATLVDFAKWQQKLGVYDDVLIQKGLIFEQAMPKKGRRRCVSDGAKPL